MRSRGPLLTIVFAAAAAGVAAFLLYFWMPSSLLDGSRISAYSCGPLGVSLRELEVRDREQHSETIDELVLLANEAKVSGTPATRQEGDPMVILFRDDGLQFVLTVSDDVYVAVSEGDGSYLGSLESPALSGLITRLVSLREGDE